ncbi:TonB-dependent receptor [Maricaulaceae bacterium EIL42A08]|nr:TonB-dependent receptor [Maricaulaceae bacterium EIL42A08]
MFKKLAYGASIATLAALAPVAAVHAQSTTASLRGTVVDASGAPVSGASVTILHVPTGSVSVTTTSANGSFFEAGLRPGGPYTVTVTAAGQEPQRAEGVRLSTGQVNSFNATLDAASTSDVITVVGTAIQSQLGLNGGVGSVFSAEDLAGQPSIQRDVISSLIADPFVTTTTFSGRGRSNGVISVAGQAPRFNGFVIDGLAQGNDFGLDQGLFPTLRQPISIDWVEEASVQASDYSVLSSGFTGGIVNLVTKSGTNEFDGGAYYYYRDQSFVGENAFDQEVSNDDFEEDEYGFYAGGPIIEDQLFFFAGYESVTNSRPLNFDFNGADPAIFDVIRDITQATYNYDPGSKADTSVDEESESSLIKLDWDITANHRATVSWQASEDSLLTNTGTFSFPTNYYVLSSQQDVYRGELVSDWTDNFSTTFRLSRKEYIRGQDSLGEDSAAGVSFGEFEVEVDVNDPYFAANGLDGDALLGGRDRTFRLGPDQFRHQNYFEDERTVFYGEGNYIWNDHVITFGGQWEQYDLFNIFGQRSRGFFEFSSLEALENQDAFVTYINAQSNDSNDTAAEWGYEQLSLFAQDAWQIRPDLNITYGIRYDRIYQDDVPPAPEPVPNATNTALLTFEDVYGFSGTDNLDGVDLIQPRFGFTYTPTDRLTVSGGMGLYSGGNPQVWASNNFTPATYFALGFDTNVTGSAVPQSILDDVAQGVSLGGAVQNIDVFAPGFEMPNVLRASLRADYELNLERFGLGDGYFVSASVLHSDRREALIWRNLAFDRPDLEFARGVAPDGRPIYPDLGDIPDQSDPANLDADENTNGSEYSLPDAFAIDTTEGGSATAYAITVSKRYDAGFNFRFGYTYTEAEDLLEYTSSRAVSAWRGIVGTDRNNPVVATSSNEIEHKFTVTLGYENEFVADLTSRFNVFGFMQSGPGFSYGYNVGGSNPIFGRALGGSPRDGADLLYVPLAGGDPAVEFASAADEAAFDNFVRQEGLEQFRGTFVPRNFGSSPWTQRWDFRFTQDLPGIPGAEQYVGENRFQFVLDIENFPNLLNDEWGTQYRRGGSFGRASVVDLDIRELNGGELLSDNEPGEFCKAATDCRYVYSDVTSPTQLQSRDFNNSVYRVRMGLRYEF